MFRMLTLVDLCVSYVSGIVAEYFVYLNSGSLVRGSAVDFAKAPGMEQHTNVAVHIYTLTNAYSIIPP